MSPKKNDVAVFVSNFMNNMLYKDHYIALSEKVSMKIKAKETIESYEIDRYLACDTFAVFDKLILNKLIQWLSDECVHEQGLIPKIASIVNGRLKKYFSVAFLTEYRCIQAAYTLVDVLTVPKTGEHLVDQYVQSLRLVDTAYRKFNVYFDRLENNSGFLQIRQLIENLYTNAFLAKLSLVWGGKLATYQSITEIPHTKQSDFYRMFVAPAVKRECTVVIISDALRYECAAELSSLFSDGAKYAAETRAYDFHSAFLYRAGHGSVVATQKHNFYRHV